MVSAAGQFAGALAPTAGRHAVMTIAQTVAHSLIRIRPPCCERWLVTQARALLCAARGEILSPYKAGFHKKARKTRRRVERPSEERQRVGNFRLNDIRFK